MRTLPSALLAFVVTAGCGSAKALQGQLPPPDSAPVVATSPPASGGAGGVAVPDSAPPAQGGTTAEDAAAPAGPDRSSLVDAAAMGDGAAIVAGMVKLFNGTTLDGWDGNPQIWSVKDGAIDGLSTTGGQLIYTKGDYDSFRLTLESRLVSKTQHLGVCFWGGRTPTWGYSSCILVIPPSGGMWDYHKGIKSPPHTNPASANVDPGTWHKSEILANAATGEVWMAVNGVQVLIYKNMTGHVKGPIGLQIHDGSSEVQYRELYLEENPTDWHLVTVKQP